MAEKLSLSSRENSHFMLKRPKLLPMTFREKFLKTKRGEGLGVCISSCTSFLWVEDEVTGDVSGILIIRLLVPTSLGSSARV